MPTTPPPSNSTLPQALSELSKLAPTSEVAKQGVEVIVKQLSDNLLSLTGTSGLLKQPALLPNPEIKGNINSGQPHTIKLNTTSSPVLEFFSNQVPVDKKIIELTQQQLESLLKLPPKQLMAQLTSTSLLTSSQTKSTIAIPNNGLLLNATVLASPPNSMTTDTVTLNRPATNNPINTPLANSNPLLRLLLTDAKPPVEIALPLKQALAAGEKITLVVTPKGQNYQLNVQTATAKPASPLSDNSLDTNQAKQPLTQGSQSAKSSSNQSLLVSPSQAVNISKALIQQLSANSSTNTQIELPVKAVLQQLAKTPLAQTQTLSQTLQTMAIDKLSLTIDNHGKFQLLVGSHKPVASIPITKEIAHALAPLKLPNQQSVVKIINQLTNTEQAITAGSEQKPTEASLKHTVTKPLAQIFSQLGGSAKKVWLAHKEQRAQTNDNLIANKTADTKVSSENIKPQTAANAQEKSPGLASPPQVTKHNNEQTHKNLQAPFPAAKAENAVNLQDLATKLQQQVNLAPSESSLVTSNLLASKQQQIGLIQQLLRVVQAKADAPSINLQNIEQALSDKELSKQTSEQSNKQIFEQGLQQIKSALPQGKESDANNIKQLLTTPALNLTPVQLVSATTNQGFINGLITVLQMSLSARLTRFQSSREEQVARVLNTILPSSEQSKSSVTAKGLSEAFQLEQKHQLIREIGRLFSSHQTNKFRNAEQLLQGQESFYYNLPSFMNGAFQDIEFLIKREENPKEQASDEESASKTWQLTMKLGIGELGELLTKAKLRPDNLDVNFYASNQEVQIQVMNYLPLLKRRLKSLGIEVSQSQCQLGKIPDSLQERPYHVFQTKV